MKDKVAIIPVRSINITTIVTIIATIVVTTQVIQ